jgi:hypothetical protein
MKHIGMNLSAIIRQYIQFNKMKQTIGWIITDRIPLVAHPGKLQDLEVKSPTFGAWNRIKEVCYFSISINKSVRNQIITLQNDTQLTLHHSMSSPLAAENATPE